MIEAKTILKYQKYSLPDLLKIATKHFNRFIRERDRLGDSFFCPTCKRTKRIEGDNYQACHCFPAGFYPWLRFDENNCFGGCKSCNYYKHGASYIYNDWVRKKIGDEAYQKLLDDNDYYKSHGFKWDRFTIIEVVIKYK